MSKIDENALQQLLVEHHLTQEDPCPRCSYDIYQHRLGSPSCVRCFPPRGFHVLSDHLYAMHPWKRQAVREL